MKVPKKMCLLLHTTEEKGILAMTPNNKDNFSGTEKAFFSSRFSCKEFVFVRSLQV